MTRRRRVVAGPLAAFLVVAGCGSNGPAKSAAAEPATAPPTSAAPAGSVRQVGTMPEGIVYDVKTDLVAVTVRGPDRLLLLDPATLAVRRTVPLPGHARHLQLAASGGPVLVPAEDASQLVEVSLPGGVQTAYDVQQEPHDAAATSDGDVVVGNEFSKSISIIRGGTVVKTISDLTQPGGVVAVGPSEVAVVDVGAFSLSTYDLTTLKRTGRINAGNGPTHGVLIPGGRVVVADTRGNAMLVYSVDPLKRIGALPLPGAPYGLATDESTGLVWVTLTARNQVVGLDVSGNTPKVVARYDTVRQPNTVAVAPGSHRLWVAGENTGVVELIKR
ncbi:MAG: YncE family protein [Nakamurella sp.]